MTRFNPAFAFTLVPGFSTVPLDIVLIFTFQRIRLIGQSTAMLMCRIRSAVFASFDQILSVVGLTYVDTCGS